MKVLWLASWYPNKHDAFEGDFIQRHARAAALHHDITVIYVNQSEKNLQQTEMSNVEGRLTEHIIYLPPFTQKYFWNIWRKHHRYIIAFKEAVSKYIEGNGEPDIIHVQIPVKAGLAGLSLKHRYRLPMIVSEHWGIYANTFHDDISRKSFSFRLLTKRVIKEADQLVTVSDYLGETINKAGFEKEYAVIPNVADTDRFCYHNNTSSGKFRFLHVSNLLSVKNPRLMLDAIRIFLSKRSDAEFVFIGNSDNNWSDYARDIGVADAVSFRGVIPYDEVAAEMQKAHSLFLYSDFETFSCVTVEALCSGMPVITARTGASPELVNDGNGILVEPGSPYKLAEAFEKMMSEYDRYNKAEISKQAADQYSYQKVSAQFDELYRSLKS